MHSRQIFLSVETEEMERSGFPKAWSTRGKTLLNITGWSANHSARAPTGRREKKNTVDENTEHFMLQETKETGAFPVLLSN